MSVISSWLLSIASVVLLSVLSEFVLPEGQMNKYIKVVFSFVILLVIILPLPRIVKSEVDLSTLLEQKVGVQENFLEQINLDKLNTISTEINKKIASSGLENINITINANIFSEKLEIYGINADLRNIKYRENFENKNISSAKKCILKIIKSYKELQDVEVIFDE